MTQHPAISIDYIIDQIINNEPIMTMPIPVPDERSYILKSLEREILAECDLHLPLTPQEVAAKQHTLHDLPPIYRLLIRARDLLLSEVPPPSCDIFGDDCADCSCLDDGDFPDVAQPAPIPHIDLEVASVADAGSEIQLPLSAELREGWLERFENLDHNDFSVKITFKYTAFSDVEILRLRRKLKILEEFTKALAINLAKGTFKYHTDFRTPQEWQAFEDDEFNDIINYRILKQAAA